MEKYIILVVLIVYQYTITRYYEWKQDPRTNKKQPFYIHLPEGRLMMIAAIWDIQENKKGNYYC